MSGLGLSGDIVGLGKIAISKGQLGNHAQGFLPQPDASGLPVTSRTNPGMPRIATTAPASDDLIKPTSRGQLDSERAMLKQQLLSPDTEVAGNAERRLAELNSQNPWGTAANHPGGFGKVMHGLAKAGNVAGDIVAPGTMANIPNTDMNRQQQRNQGLFEESQGVDNNASRARTANQLDEIRQRQLGVKPEYVTYREPVYNPKSGKYEEAAYNKANPQDIVYGGAVEPKTVAAKDENVPLGDKVGAINDQLLERYQVLHPEGKVLPSRWTVPDNATLGDYNRVDKAMEQVERAEGTKAQQEAANLIRQQTSDAQKLGREQAAAAKGRKMVIGTNPLTHREEMVPESNAGSLADVYDAPADAVNKTISARHFIPLADNKDPNDPGILQMIDKMSKEGKLGAVTSRWNDFLAGKVGAGDEEFERLRVAMGLATTLLMNAHVGSRGGAYMMEHFENLANAGTMNASTLRSGVDQELKYIKNRAMVPASSTASTGVVPAGGRPILKGGKQVGYIDAKGKRVDF